MDIILRVCAMVQAVFGLSVTAENWVRFLARKYQICFE